ncbi:P27 family phage terminase small subunit [Peribacillus sp. TH27]|uniref:P27 family phage terminase small subunit n=1 Tax=Peribacillus sp. TH27 TaxID=2798484 RepID=UPI0019137662|nr:P27 family phage terminase small subunit [Peribacillus sp. TH27]MBK5458046.1 P27 family phage terminase small subunit [Peribacillus sp. TH27]
MQIPVHFNHKSIQQFNFIVEELSKLNKLNPTDQPIIERIAFNLATIEECEIQLLKDGFVLEGLHGKKEHPALGISMKAQAKVLEAFKLLGLDASSRLKEEQSKPEDCSNDPLLKLLGRV